MIRRSIDFPDRFDCPPGLSCQYRVEIGMVSFQTLHQRPRPVVMIRRLRYFSGVSVEVDEIDSSV